jgi:hypothetical protein
MRIRFGAIYFAAFFSVLLMLRVFMAWTEKWTLGNNLWAKARIHGSLNALHERQLKEENVVLFLGASEAEVGFDPIEYDSRNREAGKSSLTFNLAVHNNGTFLPLYFERVAVELERADLHPRIIFVHFPISRLTTMALHHYAEMQKAHDLPAAYFDPALWRLLPNVADKTEIALNKWLWGERSLLQIPLFFERFFKFATGQIPLRPDQILLTKLTRHSEDGWRDRGRFYHDIFEQSPGIVGSKVYAMRKGGVYEMVKQNDTCCDFSELHFDADYSARVLESLKKVSRFAAHTVIVHLPENPVYERSRDSAARREAFLSEAAVAVQGEAWSFEYPRQLFIDLLHFSPRGAIAFSDDLSEKTPADWLKSASK